MNNMYAHPFFLEQQGLYYLKMVFPALQIYNQEIEIYKQLQVEHVIVQNILYFLHLDATHELHLTDSYLLKIIRNSMLQR